MSILKNKKGEFKDFTCLQVACEMKKIENKILESIKSASITSGLKNLSPKQQRDIMYKDLRWLQVIKAVELLI